MIMTPSTWVRLPLRAAQALLDMLTTTEGYPVELCFGSAVRRTSKDRTHLGVQMLRPGPRRLRRYCGETGAGLSFMLQACCGSAARCFASSSSRVTTLARRMPVLASGRAWLSACCSSSARCGWFLQRSPQ